jgi:hypothetical protein
VVAIGVDQFGKTSGYQYLELPERVLVRQVENLGGGRGVELRGEVDTEYPERGL